MANVNLSTFNSEENKQIAVTGGAVAGIAAVFILVLLAWGGLFFYGRYLEKKITEAKASYKTYVDELAKGDSAKVIDFQRRLDVSKELIGKGRNTQEDLVRIESLMVPNAYLSSYSYDDEKKKITLSCMGDNFNTVARQILSMKNSRYFSTVVAGTSSVDLKTNQISFPIELTIAPEIKN